MDVWWILAVLYKVVVQYCWCVMVLIGHCVFGIGGVVIEAVVAILMVFHGAIYRSSPNRKYILLAVHQ